MEMFVVDFKGSLIVQADSEKDAREKAELWTSLMEEKAPKLLLPEVTAVVIRPYKERDGGAKKRLKEKAGGSGGGKKDKKKK